MPQFKIRSNNNKDAFVLRADGVVVGTFPCGILVDAPAWLCKMVEENLTKGFWIEHIPERESP